MDLGHLGRPGQHRPQVADGHVRAGRQPVDGDARAGPGRRRHRSGTAARRCWRRAPAAAGRPSTPGRPAPARRRPPARRWRPRRPADGSSAQAKWVNRPDTSSPSTPASARTNAGGPVGGHAQAVHAGVDLHVDADRGVERPGGLPERPGRVEVEHGQGQVEPHRLPGLPSRRVAEDQDRRTDAGRPQGPGLGHAGHAQPGRPAAQCGVGHRHRAVPVGVGLEHHHHLGTARPCRQVADVVGHRRQVDLQPRRAVGLHDPQRVPGPVLADQQLGGVGVVGQQPGHHPLHAGHRAPLHQGHGAGAEVPGRLGDGVLGGEGDGHLCLGQPGPHGGVGDPGGVGALGHQDVHHLGRPAADLAVELLARRPQLRHAAQHGDAGRAGQCGQGVEAGQDRPGRGVVRVVEQEAARRGPAAGAAGRAPARPARRRPPRPRPGSRSGRPRPGRPVRPRRCGRRAAGRRRAGRRARGGR